MSEIRAPEHLLPIVDDVRERIVFGLVNVCSSQTYMVLIDIHKGSEVEDISGFCSFECEDAERVILGDIKKSGHPHFTILNAGGACEMQYTFLRGTIPYQLCVAD